MKQDIRGVLVCSIIGIEAWVVGATGAREVVVEMKSWRGCRWAAVICRPLQGLWLLLPEKEADGEFLNREHIV